MRGRIKVNKKTGNIGKPGDGKEVTLSREKNELRVETDIAFSKRFVPLPLLPSGVNDCLVDISSTSQRNFWKRINFVITSVWLPQASLHTSSDTSRSVQQMMKSLEMKTRLVIFVLFFVHLVIGASKEDKIFSNWLKYCIECDCCKHSILTMTMRSVSS